MGGQRKTQWCKRKHVSPSLLKAWKRSLAGQLRKRIRQLTLPANNRKSEQWSCST
jgi:hypothetical protein